MVGVIGFLYHEQVSHDLRFNLNETFITQYEVDDVITKSIDNLQENVSFNDFYTGFQFIIE